MKRGLNAFVKVLTHVSLRSLTWAETFRYFFSACEGTIPHHEQVGYLTKWILWTHN